MQNYQIRKPIIKVWNKNRTEVTLNLLSDLVGDSNDETNFPHKPLLIL